MPTAPPQMNPHCPDDPNKFNDHQNHPKIKFSLSTSLKLLFKTGNGIIQTGNGIISPIS